MSRSIAVLFFSSYVRSAQLYSQLYCIQDAPGLPGIILRTGVSTNLTILQPSAFQAYPESRARNRSKSKARSLPIVSKRAPIFFFYFIIEKRPFHPRLDLSPPSRLQIRRENSSVKYFAGGSGTCCATNLNERTMSGIHVYVHVRVDI